MANLQQFSNLPNLFQDLQQEMQRLFHWSPTTTGEESLTEFTGGEWFPPMDVEDTAQSLILTLDVPGVSSKDLEISLENNYLIIRGQRQAESKKEGRHFSRCERVCGNFMRRLSIPNNVDTSKIVARNKNGILEIVLPKTHSTTNKQIPITSEH